MKVLVLGAGVVGTAAAWYLAEAGHEVTVLERRDGVGLDTSFANGGQVSPCHSEPWANPAVLPKVLKWLGKQDAPLLFRWNRWDPALWHWCLRFLHNCRPARTQVNIERTLRVALYSRACLDELRDRCQLSYDQLTLGILHIYRNRQEFDHACQAAEAMRRHGLRRDILDPAQCMRTEPALRHADCAIVGGIHTPDDESGDACKFTGNLARLAAQKGVVFRTGTTLYRLNRDGDRIVSVETNAGTLTADAYVLAAGSYSPLLARPIGLSLPIIPAKGYSITVNIDQQDAAPRVSLTDDEYKIVYSRLGNRLRVAGTAEMAGYDDSLRPERWQAIRRRAMALFPQAGDYQHCSPWAGLRPTTPDSVPLLGPTPIRNLWLNTGHGTLGWTMACGSGRILADLISGRPPEINVQDLGMDRFRHFL